MDEETLKANVRAGQIWEYEGEDHVLHQIENDGCWMVARVVAGRELRCAFWKWANTFQYAKMIADSWEDSRDYEIDRIARGILPSIIATGPQGPWAASATDEEIDRIKRGFVQTAFMMAELFVEVARARAKKRRKEIAVDEKQLRDLVRVLGRGGHNGWNYDRDPIPPMRELVEKAAEIVAELDAAAP